MKKKRRACEAVFRGGRSVANVVAVRIRRALSGGEVGGTCSCARVFVETELTAAVHAAIVAFCVSATHNGLAGGARLGTKVAAAIAVAFKRASGGHGGLGFGPVDEGALVAGQELVVAVRARCSRDITLDRGPIGARVCVGGARDARLHHKDVTRTRSQHDGLGHSKSLGTASCKHGCNNGLGHRGLFVVNLSDMRMIVPTLQGG